MKIKNIFKRWYAIKKLINSDEYFLTVSNQINNIEPWRGPINYEYLNNTDRRLFYIFIQDHIKEIIKEILE